MLMWMPKIYNRGALPESKALTHSEGEGGVGSWSGRVPGPHFHLVDKSLEVDALSSRLHPGIEPDPA